MKLKKNVYETMEFAEEDNCGMTTGNIVLYGDKFHCAEIVGTTMFDLEDLKRMRMFLDEVEKVMEQTTLYHPCAHNYTYSVAHDGRGSDGSRM